MRFNRMTRIAAAVAVVGAVAAGGAAFTAGETLPANVAGYGTATVTGGVITDLKYTLSSDGQYIDSASLTFTGDVSADTIGIGFDSYSSGDLQSCTVGTYTSPSTPVTCTFTDGTITTTDQDNVHVAVTGP
ncbi:MAG: hypothetical protein ACRDLT_14295 [Solirubrobacteraceae bacterium]